MSVEHKKQLIDNTLWVYAGKIITQILGLFATVLVIRKLPVEVYGTYTFIFGLFVVYQLFITSPLKNVLLRYVPELTQGGHFNVVRKLLLYALSLASAMVLLFSFFLWVFQDSFSAFFNIDSFDTHIKAFFVFVLCYALKVLSETIISSFLKHPLSAKANVLVVLFRASAYLIMLDKITVNMLLYIEAIASLVFVAFVLTGIYQQLSKANNPDNHTNVLTIKGRVSRFYLLSFFSELGYGIIGKTSDHYIIAAMSSPFYVGLYAFALKVFEIFYKILPFREFESVLKPIFFKRFSYSGSHKEINDFYMFAVKVLLPLFMFPVLYFLLFGKGVIIHVFEEKYLPAYWVTCVSLVGILINGYFYPLNLVIQLKERVEINLYSRVIVVFSIVAGIYFMKLYGIVGVAMATVLGEFFKNVFMLIMLRRYVPIKYPLAIISRYGALFLLMGALCLPFYTYLQTLGGWLLGSVAFGILYALVLINIHPLNKEEAGRLEGLVTSSSKLRKVYEKIEPFFNKCKVLSK
ncbi:Membrane protein involved in the export of O-antigen and teichoic acid [Saccharicrinis carchari]|uniref:Membrane protein involved in the export of O-antigen and teichoic acid n=1 Tax=Saccharicrinis carchari TaxID=1168039 RepID=A0A521BRI6_SACCC|nr:polysaccharide biosynthesis C-terminal domain-containing protein [Saccharicrinis carchari]SMO49733.1 Membrane protein involved in the export of O-antigen and teichoic acid [Saccharicrinis carchari]